MAIYVFRYGRLQMMGYEVLNGFTRTVLCNFVRNFLKVP